MADTGRERAVRAQRAQATRAALLAAAGRVFGAEGYADAGVEDIVSQAGTSVGTMYHHFGSKAGLYTELYLDYQSRQHRRSARAFRAAVASVGQADPMRLFLAGARAYLEGAWQDRHIARIFAAGGGPPGFDSLVRRRFHDWLKINAAGFGAQGPGEHGTGQQGPDQQGIDQQGADQQGPDQQARPFSEVRLLALTAIVTEAGREVTEQSSKGKALTFINEMLELMAQLHPPKQEPQREPESAGEREPERAAPA
jgi:AcrR family transcriptional regulator